jgi:hypothetical protein
VTLGFRLLDATVSRAGNTVTITGPSAEVVLTGFERFVFTDGTVDDNDGSPLIDDLFYYAKYHDVWTRVPMPTRTTTASAGRRAAIRTRSSHMASIFRRIRTCARHQSAGAFRHDRLAGRTPAVAQLRSDAVPLANPDVAAAHVDPLRHYLQFGAQEGAIPFAPTEFVNAAASTTSATCRTIRMSRRRASMPLLHFQTSAGTKGAIRTRCSTPPAIWRPTPTSRRERQPA